MKNNKNGISYQKRRGKPRIKTKRHFPRYVVLGGIVYDSDVIDPFETHRNKATKHIHDMPLTTAAQKIKEIINALDEFPHKARSSAFREIRDIINALGID